MLKTFMVFFIIVGFASVLPLPFANVGIAAQSSATDNSVERVICNVILFVQRLGLPIMTGVIIGSSIMAIFGRLPWPAIVMLVVFTAIFFGASKLISKFVQGVNNEMASAQDCSAITNAS